jgi:tetratricopeptide (TPR) repeat protein
VTSSDERPLEGDLLDELARTLTPVGEAPKEAMDLVEASLKKLPTSPALWVRRGQLIQLHDGSLPYTLEDSLKSFEKAVELCPTFAKAYVEIGYYLDAIAGDLPGAEAAFRRAVELDGGANAYEGLGRVLAQMGKTKEALELLERCCLIDVDGRLAHIAEEIRAGQWRME